MMYQFAIAEGPMGSLVAVVFRGQCIINVPQLRFYESKEKQRFIRRKEATSVSHES